MMGERSTGKDIEEIPIATMEALSQHLPGNADEKHESPQWEKLVSPAKYEFAPPECKTRGLPLREPV